ncbi:MAG: DUF4352 domain-containing protein [Chloroflexota bacterium]|nr:DUF4352 domain-containing protein [Chloroflexota bacterium]
MPKKLATKREYNAFFSAKRREGVGCALAVSLLIAGALLLFFSHTYTNIGSSARFTIPARLASQKGGTLVPESEWGMWHTGDLGQTFPTLTHPFVLGQTITVPNDVFIRVDSVDRNWTPHPWQVSPFGAGYQDDATGKEVILVRFTIKNLGKSPVMYSDSYFSLVRANGHEQRVADRDELTGDHYGSFGQATPWLEPGTMKHTFVPFLVNPGEKPEQFVFSWRKASLASSQNGTEILPSPLNIARIPIALSASPAPGTSSSSVTFVPDTTFTVTGVNVYSTSPTPQHLQAKR